MRYCLLLLTTSDPNADAACNGLKNWRIKVTESSCVGDKSCMALSRCKVGAERKREELFEGGAVREVA